MLSTAANCKRSPDRNWRHGELALIGSGRISIEGLPVP
jgi:hypothetical protein